MTMTTAGFHHIALVSGDLRRSALFYEGVLGLVRLTPATGESRERFDAMFGDEKGNPGTLVALLDGSGSAPGRAGIGGVHHLALGTAGESSLLRWKRRLTDMGVPVSGPYDRGYFTSLYFRDPDGQVVEIATAGPGYDIDEAPDSLGRGVMHPPERLIAGVRDEAAIAALTHPEPVPTITEDMRLTGLHHISGITDDLERLGDFYEEALGLRLIKKTVNRDDPDTPHWFWARYDGASVATNSSFTLFGWPPSWNRARAGTGQTHHIAFRARDDDELLEWRDHLLGRGIEVASAGRGATIGALRFHAPDGQPVEIATDLPGFRPG